MSQVWKNQQTRKKPGKQAGQTELPFPLWAKNTLVHCLSHLTLRRLPLLPSSYDWCRAKCIGCKVWIRFPTTVVVFVLVYSKVWSLHLSVSVWTEAGSAILDSTLLDSKASPGGTLAGSLPVIARWLQPGPLGKNPHWKHCTAMNKSPEFDMLKELKNLKERVRHLNHRKEKAQPRN